MLTRLRRENMAPGDTGVTIVSRVVWRLLPGHAFNVSDIHARIPASCRNSLTVSVRLLC